jgi:hypothetical protein
MPPYDNFNQREHIEGIAMQVIKGNETPDIFNHHKKLFP